MQSTTTVENQTTYEIPFAGEDGEDTQQVEGHDFIELYLFDEETTYGVPDAGEESQPVRGFTRIYNDVIRDSSVSRNARLTYIILESYAYGEREDCFPGQDTLAEHLGVCDRTVRTYLAELEAAGWINKQHRPLEDGKNKTDLYTLHHKVEGSTTATDRKCTSAPDWNHTSAPDRNRTSGKEYEVEKEKIKNLSLIGANAPQEENQEEQGMVAGRESAPTTSFPDQPTEQQIPAAPGLAKDEVMPTGKELVTRMQARLKSQGYDPLNDDEARMYGANFKRLMASDNPCREAMLEVVDVLVDDWGRSSGASPQKFYREDVRGNYLVKDTDTDTDAPMAEYSTDDGGEEDLKEILARLARIEDDDYYDLGDIVEDTATATEQDVPGPEESPEGYTTPESANGRYDGLREGVERILTESRDGAAFRLAVAAVEGKGSPQGPITRENVAYVLRDELQLSEADALTAADQMIQAIRDEQEVSV